MKVRLSIANLAWYAQVSGSAIRHPFGIVNQRKLAKGERWYQALGGGAMLTDRGKKMLEDNGGATSFELDSNTGFYDARFVIDEAHVEAVWRSFWCVSPWFERDPTLDIMAELTGNEPGHVAILSEEEAGRGVLPVYLTTMQQKPAAIGADTSARASSEMPTLRLFRIFTLVMHGATFDKFMESRNVRLLTDGELATTNGGSQAGRTIDECVIQNNLFLPPR